MRMKHRINNRGMMECWNDEMTICYEKTQYSNIPLFQSDVLLDVFDDVFGRGPWEEDLPDPRLFKCWNIIHRDNATSKNKNIIRFLLLKDMDNFWKEAIMGAGQT